MSTEQATVSVGASAANKYCLPVDDWGPKYGTLLPMRIDLRRFATGEICAHVVFHSENPPNRLLDLQAYVSNQMTTRTFIDTEPDNAFREDTDAAAGGCRPTAAAESTRAPSMASSEQQNAGIHALPDGKLSSSQQYTHRFLQNRDNSPHLHKEEYDMALSEKSNKAPAITEEAVRPKVKQEISEREFCVISFFISGAFSRRLWGA